MSGLDVEALLESTAAPAAQDSPRSQDRDDRPKSDHPDRRDRDRSRERERRRRDRSRDRRRDADGDEDMKSDHGSANGSHRSRKRSRSRDSRRSRRDRDDYRSGGDFYRGGGRARTRSRSPYDDRYYRPSGRPRRDDREDDRRSRRDRKRSPGSSRTKSPELTEDERDRRTIFVQQLAARLRTKELIGFFEKVGPVKEAQIVKDRVSGRSKG